MSKVNFNRVKDSLKRRCKNVYFWIGLAGTFLLAGGVDPSTLTTWPKLLTAFIDIFKNPYILIYCTMTILGNFVDTSTPGLKDVRSDDDLCDAYNQDI